MDGCLWGRAGQGRMHADILEDHNSFFGMRSGGFIFFPWIVMIQRATGRRDVETEMESWRISRW